MRSSLLAMFCVSAAVFSGCSSPGGDQPVTLDAQGGWGLKYGQTVALKTTYSDGTSKPVDAPISAVVTSGLPDAGGGYVEKLVFFYDATSRTVTVGQPNPATDGGGPEVPTTQTFVLDSSNSMVISTGAPTFQAISAPIATDCGVETTTTEKITFSADGSSLVLTEDLSMAFLANNVGTGVSCTQYLAQEQTKVQTNVATDVANYIQNFSAFLSTGDIVVSDMSLLSTFELNLSVTGDRLSDSLNVPQNKPIELVATDARMGRMFARVLTGRAQ